MRIRFILAVMVSTLTSNAVLAQSGETKQIFHTRCMSCHQPPDASLSVDRAWLDQIHRTS